LFGPRRRGEQPTEKTETLSASRLTATTRVSSVDTSIAEPRLDLPERMEIEPRWRGRERARALVTRHSTRAS
jgi:hypothetical protein